MTDAAVNLDPPPTDSRPLGRLLAMLLIIACPTVAAAAEPADLLGDWVLNSELTHEMQPKQSGGGGGGFGTPSISVGWRGYSTAGRPAATRAAAVPETRKCSAATP